MKTGKVTAYFVGSRWICIVSKDVLAHTLDAY